MTLPSLGIYGPSGSDRSGVATYIRGSLTYLERYFSVQVISNSTPWKDPQAFDYTLYHLGNNAMHHSAFKAVSARPGVSLLHEYVLLDYYYQVWETLDRKTREEILAALSRLSGIHAASAREFIRACEVSGSVDPYALDIGIERYSVKRSAVSLVHSESVANVLRARYPDRRVETLPFPVAPWRANEELTAIALRRHGIEPDMFVFGSFGFIGEFKRIPLIVDAWRGWRQRPPEARLLLVGARQIRIDTSGEGIIETGWVDDETFAALMRRVDCGIQLRHPTLGETSAPAAAFCAHRRPVILSDIPEMRGLGAGAHLQFVRYEGGRSALLAMMCLQYERGRSGSISFDQAFSWASWAERMRQVLTTLEKRES